MTTGPHPRLPQLAGLTIHPYSDLLLHDTGERKAAASAASTSRISRSVICAPTCLCMALLPCLRFGVAPCGRRERCRRVFRPRYL